MTTLALPAPRPRTTRRDAIASASTPRSTTRSTTRRAEQRLEVHKFGGAALADATAVRRVAAILAARGARPTVVVASAVAGVTDALVALADAAPTITEARLTLELARLRAIHVAIADVTLAADACATALAVIDAACADVAAVVRAARVLGHVPPDARDRLLAHGDRLSAALLALVLADAGLPATAVDAERCIVASRAVGIADAGGAAPTIDVRGTTTAARRALGALLDEGRLPVLAGFVGGDADGAPVTLGRGGSDLTATLLARVLGAHAAVLWKEVPGLLTADPRIVPGARRLAAVDAREAAELAQHGARVLHPRAVAALGARARLVVRGFASPDALVTPHGVASGTVVRARATSARTHEGATAGTATVRAIAAAMDQAIVQVGGDPLDARPSVVTRALGALDRAGVPITLAAQGAAGAACAIVVAAGDARRAAETVARAVGEPHSLTVRDGAIDVGVRAGVAVIGVIGTGIADDPAVASRAFGALGAAKIRVLASAYGASASGLSLVVDATRAAEAQRVLHAAFALHVRGSASRADGRVGASTRDTAPTNVVLLGAGAIGRTLLSQIVRAPRASSAALRVCAVADRSGFVVDPSGLSARTLAALRTHKATGAPLSTFDGAVHGDAAACVAQLVHATIARPVLVDVTAADTTAVVTQALAAGWDVVLANKVPLAGVQAACDRLRAAAATGGGRVLHEATVGAGLPVLDTLRKLQEAGDRVQRVEGCPSGTLGFLFAELGRGRRFSDALRAAVAAGYTEPDPRVDLSGMDVARKAIILARQLGWRGDPRDVPVESLVPPALAALPLDAFLARLDECDAPWEARVREARERGRVLRYRVRVTRRRVDVGLVEAAPTDPLGALTGTDNQFAFTTARYRQQPLVVTGPGAGAEVTAAGVLGDLLRVAAERAG